MNIRKFLFDKDKHLYYARKVASILEYKFSIFKFKFGIDPLIGLIPGLGDAITTFLSFYLIFVAVLHKIQLKKVIYMIFIVVADFAIGSIPVIGNILDFVVKPNVKNLSILEYEINEKK